MAQESAIGAIAITDEELIRQVLSGNQDAYAGLVRAHQSKVIGLCALLLNNSSQAEDAAQEIFIKAYRNLASFKGRSSFSTWIYRITNNHCIDLLRKISREKSESLDALIETSGDAFQKLIEFPSDAGARLEANDTVEKILSFLSPEERLILTLREAQGLNYVEIAQTLECTVDAVKARLKRVREKLNKNLRHFLDPVDV